MKIFKRFFVGVLTIFLVSFSQINATSSHNNNHNSKNNNNSNSNINNINSNPNAWNCSTCGNINHISFFLCMGCGSPKNLPLSTSNNACNEDDGLGDNKEYQAKNIILSKEPSLATTLPQQIDCLAYTNLHKVAKVGKIPALKKALETNPNQLNNTNNDEHITPMLLATKHKNWQVVKWFIENGAWIDVKDHYEKGILDYVGNAPKAIRDVLMPYILESRDIYPLASIDQAIEYVMSRCYNKHTKKTINLGQIKYRKYLLEAVSQLIGMNPPTLSMVINFTKDYYKATTQNIKIINKEEIGEIDYTQGAGVMQILPLRIHLIFNILIDLKKIKNDYPGGLPINSKNNKVYSWEEIYQKGKKELQTQLTSLWDNKAMDYCHPTYHRFWAKSIINRLKLSPSPTEFSIPVGHEGNCIYLSISNYNDICSVRIDSRWLNTANQYGFDHPKNSEHAIQPYLVTHFPKKSLLQYSNWLERYLVDAVKLCFSPAYKAIPHLYKKHPSEGNKSKWIANWYYRPQQTTAENCVIRSHNVGYRIRLGDKNLYRWYRKQSLSNYLLERTFKDEENENNQAS